MFALRAQAVARARTADTLMARAHFVAGAALMQVGDWTDAMRQLSQAERFYTAQKDVGAQCKVLTQLAVACCELGEYSEALDGFGQALTLAREHNENAAARRVLVHQSTVHTMLGDFEAARASLRAALELPSGIDGRRRPRDHAVRPGRRERGPARRDGRQRRQPGLPVSAVIHHGVRPEDFPVGAGDGDYLLFLGRFSPDKGAREAALAAHEAGVDLVIAAKMREPDEVAYFHDQVEPLLDSSVRYVGEVGMQRKLELLGSARALLNPIQWPEPFGLVMIEALACGTPVLTLHSGAAPEIVDHGITGFVSDSADGLVPAIERIGELDRTACRTAMETRFSAARMVEDHLTLYETLLAGDDQLVTAVGAPRAL